MLSSVAWVLTHVCVRKSTRTDPSPMSVKTQAPGCETKQAICSFEKAVTSPLGRSKPDTEAKVSRIYPQITQSNTDDRIWLIGPWVRDIGFFLICVNLCNLWINILPFLCGPNEHLRSGCTPRQSQKKKQKTVGYLGVGLGG
jgi:hypothetical protein